MSEWGGRNSETAASLGSSPIQNVDLKALEVSLVYLEGRTLKLKLLDGKALLAFTLYLSTFW